MALELSEKQTVRSRTVYNFITLVSEVSGFADLLIVFSTFAMSLLFSASAFESRVIQYLGPVIFDIKRRRRDSKEAKDIKHNLNKQNIIDLL